MPKRRTEASFVQALTRRNARSTRAGDRDDACETPRRNRLQSIGVSVTDTTPEMRMAVNRHRDSRN